MLQVLNVNLILWSVLGFQNTDKDHGEVLMAVPDWDDERGFSFDVLFI